MTSTKKTTRKNKKYETDLSYLDPLPNETPLERKQRYLQIRKNDCYLMNNTNSNMKITLKTYQNLKDTTSIVLAKRKALQDELSMNNDISTQESHPSTSTTFPHPCAKVENSPIKKTSTTSPTLAKKLSPSPSSSSSHSSNTHTSTPTISTSDIEKLSHVVDPIVVQEVEKLSHTPSTPLASSDIVPVPTATTPSDFIEYKPDVKTKDEPLPLLAKPQIDTTAMTPYSIFYLSYYSLMSPEELQRYKKNKTTPVSIAELVAIETLEDLISGTPKAKAVARKTYWDIQKTIMKKTQITGKNKENQGKSCTILDAMMDEIEPGEILEENA